MRRSERQTTSRIRLGPILLVAFVVVPFAEIAVLTRAQRQLERGAMPVAEVFEGLCLLVGGALLLTPGFITDACGALLLLPPVRGFLYRRIGHYLERHVAPPSDAPPGRRPPGQPPPVLDGEYEEVTADEPDQADDLPPPRGGWGGKR